MTSPSENTPANSTLGLSLLEVLVSLAIIGLAMTLSISAFKGPSPALLVKRSVNEVIQLTAQKQVEAISSGKPTTLTVAEYQCEPEAPEQVIVFFPDGSARGPDLCINMHDKMVRLHLVPQIGLLKEEADDEFS